MRMSSAPATREQGGDGGGSAARDLVEVLGSPVSRTRRGRRYAIAFLSQLLAVESAFHVMDVSCSEKTGRGVKRFVGVLRWPVRGASVLGGLLHLYSGFMEPFSPQRGRRRLRRLRCHRRVERF